MAHESWGAGTAVQSTKASAILCPDGACQAGRSQVVTGQECRVVPGWVHLLVSTCQDPLFYRRLTTATSSPSCKVTQPRGDPEPCWPATLPGSFLILFQGTLLLYHMDNLREWLRSRLNAYSDRLQWDPDKTPVRQGIKHTGVKIDRRNVAQTCCWYQ